jgi:acyl-CoA reductase-like NAD-dependent aldehyde dehydrogenase
VTAVAPDLETIAVHDPSTGEEIGSIPASGPQEAARAVDAARAAFPAWSRRDAADRASTLKDAARRLRVRVREIAELQTREGGKPIADSIGGVEAGIGAIEQYAELGPLHSGRTLSGAIGAADLTVREPRGVVALLVPWNDPVAIACQHIAAALVTGNAVVFKPSERTPLSGMALVDALDLPHDVLTLLCGDGRAGAALAADERVDVVLHTGSVDTGRKIAQTCGPALGRKALLELGGKDPLIVDAGVDPEWAAEQAAAGAFANAGQICTSVERIYVHRDVAEPFTAALAQRARAIRVGPGLEETTEMGPLVDDRQLAIVAEQVQEAIDAGAEALAGGKRLDRPGSFYPPTVLARVDGSMRIMREETFGPVAPVQIVDSFDAALDQANASDYGLAASVLTPSQANGQRAWRELRVGTVKVNAVWGGAPGGAAEPRGKSGTGFGYGPDLLDELTRAKVVHLEPAPTGARQAER